MRYDVLVIGAGAAGLIATRELGKAGCRVCLLEASDNAGGRISTINDGFPEPAAAGPEFIHGNLNLTLQIVQEAGLTLEPVSGNMIPVKKGKWMVDEAYDAYWDEFMNQLYLLEEDCSLADFLDRYFKAGKYASLRRSIQGFAEGFDLAELNRASAIFARQEWSHQQEPQYRIEGGYGKMINYLLGQCQRQHSDVHFNQPVHKIEHGTNAVTAYTASGECFEAGRIIITVPLGVLQNNSIIFSPAIEDQMTATRQLGFGSVIKLLFLFKRNFWKDYADDIGFILSDQQIPTWWTQAPKESNLLTGWLGGPEAALMSNLSNEALLQNALDSLASIFNRPAAELQNQLLHYKIISWQNNPYIKGGYSYMTVDSVSAKSKLAMPVANSIYFAGEAYYTGESQGTVEAALQSGMNTAQKLIASL